MPPIDMSAQPWPLNTYEIYSAKNYKPLSASGTYHVERKYDGHRRIVARRQWCEQVAYSRRLTGVPKRYRPAECPDLGLPDDTIIDCELYVNGPASDVITHLINGWPVHVRVFALLEHQGEAYVFDNYDTARAMLEDVVQHCRYDRALVTSMEPSEHLGTLIKPSVSEIEALLSDDDEGAVLKRMAYQEWYKYVREDTIDCVVTGYRPGKGGQYSGMVGALILTVYDEDGRPREVGAASGMSRAERFEMTEWAKEGKLNGRVCAVKYKNIAAGGKLRMPVFVRWRDDKNPEDCKTTQLKE